MTDLSKATPRPWRTDSSCGDQLIVDAKGCHLAWCDFTDSSRPLSEEEMTANAALIVQAVNAHDDLVTQVRLFERCVVYEIKKSEQEGDDEGARLKSFTLALIRDTLAKAEGR